MSRVKCLVAGLAILCVALAIYFVLSNEKALLTHPKGVIAHSQLSLIITQILLMLIVVVPTLVLLFIIAWKYRSQNREAEHDPKHTFSQAVLWITPSIVIAIMAVVIWKATHKLDPYKPLVSTVKPLKIQVVALDWKWLFIYPEQGIATLNFVQFPDQTPIQFELSADGSPMNSFWIPQLSGQIYAMTGMVTPLHLMADGPGEYSGRAAEINGEGFATMTFIAKSSTPADFEAWVAFVQRSPQHLTETVYNELLKPSLRDPVTLYGQVENDLFNKIVMKYMAHP